MKKRNRYVSFRVNDEEFAELDKKIKQAGLPKERFLRELAAGSRIHEAPPADFKKLIRELNRIGSNIDQILVIAYTKDILDVPRLRKELDELNAIERVIWEAFAPTQD